MLPSAATVVHVGFLFVASPMEQKHNLKSHAHMDGTHAALSSSRKHSKRSSIRTSARPYKRPSGILSKGLLKL